VVLTSRAPPFEETDMYSSGYNSTYQAEIDYRRDRIKAGIGVRPSRRRLRHRSTKNVAGENGTTR
jgi:hypothetical protein